MTRPTIFLAMLASCILGWAHATPLKDCRSVYCAVAHGDSQFCTSMATTEHGPCCRSVDGLCKMQLEGSLNYPACSEAIHATGCPSRVLACSTVANGIKLHHCQ